MIVLGVVVVHFGDPAPTRRCLASVVGDPSGVKRKVVLVDNSDSFAGSPVEGVSLVSCPENPGFGGGANRGAAALDIASLVGVVVLNHDVEIVPGFLDAAAAAIKQPGVGAAAGPLFLDSDHRRLWYAGGSVNWLTGTVRQRRTAEDAERPRTVGFLPGAAVAVAAAAWRECGGFDSRFFLYHEDLDLCLRLRRRGYSLQFAPAMGAVHRLGAATGSGQASSLYLEHLSATRLMAFRPLLFRLYLAMLHSGWVVLRAGWYLVAGSGSDAAKALLRGHGRALAGIGRGPR